MDLLYTTCNAAQRMTLRAFADWKVEGRENVPPMGPLIIVANHQGNFDPPLLAASLPRRIWFLAKDGVFNGPVVKWFMRTYGAFPVNRHGADIRAYRWTLDQLNHDRAVVIFPEGTRSRGSLRKANPGIAGLVLKSKAPLLPVGITGTERMVNVGRVFNPTGRIRVNIGTVFSLPSIEGKVGREVMQSMTDMIMSRIAALLPQSYQGAYRIAPESSDAPKDDLTPGVENVRASEHNSP